jgi:predicted patatin/cPLA2 family phospholipase
LASKVVEVDGYYLLDGGMTDSIPLEYFESIGYEKNLVILTQPRDFVKKTSKLMGLMRLALKKYPKLVDAMAKRAEVYNKEKALVFEREKAGKTFVICPETDLGISRTEHNPDELQRVYEEGRNSALARLEEIKKFVK